MKPRIVCAACQHADGRLLLGIRHFDHLMWASLLRLSLEQFEVYIRDPNHETPPEVKGWANAEQGFVDQFGKFYTREEAWMVAQANGQIIRDPDWCPGSLHSEHLY